MYVPKGAAHGFITLAELVQEHLDTDLRPMGGRRCAFCQASHRALGHAQADFSSKRCENLLSGKYAAQKESIFDWCGS
jgi:hypothetical protein